ncbi:hypothetical protein BC629DRAFT_1546094 [Irpex lacteus]|nr:hypothetical protein BC629DRAFT_1546094 [Irpex lacteus]
MSAFVNTIPCPECKAALVQHVADVCERWSEVPVRTFFPSSSFGVQFSSKLARLICVLCRLLLDVLFCPSVGALTCEVDSSASFAGDR